MNKEFDKGLDNTDNELFESDLKGIKHQINNKFPKFDLEKNDSLIRDYLILRKAIADPKRTWTEVSEMENLFDIKHNEIIDDEQIGNVLRFVTDITKKPVVIK